MLQIVHVFNCFFCLLNFLISVGDSVHVTQEREMALKEEAQRDELASKKKKEQEESNKAEDDRQDRKQKSEQDREERSMFLQLMAATVKKMQ